MSDMTVSPHAEKVFRSMLSHGIVGESKMAAADVIAAPALKLPKNKVLNALVELQNKGLIRRKVKEKSTGYFIIEGKQAALER